MAKLGTQFSICVIIDQVARLVTGACAVRRKEKTKQTNSFCPIGF